MRIVSGLLLSIVLFSGYISQKKDQDKILWSKDYLLEWKDFKGDVKQNAGYDAMTDYLVESDKQNGKLGIFCYFDKSKSWRVKKKESALLLKHEQYHFHLAEVYARMIRKQIIEQDLVKDQKQLEKVFRERLKQLDKDQKEYDKNTGHSKVATEQIRWQMDIDRQLKELEKYSSPLVE